MTDIQSTFSVTKSRQLGLRTLAFGFNVSEAHGYPAGFSLVGNTGNDVVALVISTRADQLSDIQFTHEELRKLKDGLDEYFNQIDQTGIIMGATMGVLNKIVVPKPECGLKRDKVRG